jgi:hypothetical protein
MSRPRPHSHAERAASKAKGIVRLSKVEKGLTAVRARILRGAATEARRSEP